MSERALTERERESEWYPYNINSSCTCVIDRQSSCFSVYKKLLKLNIIGCVSSSSYIKSVVCLYSLMFKRTTASSLYLV